MKPSSTPRVRSGRQTRASAPISGFAGQPHRPLGLLDPERERPLERLLGDAAREDRAHAGRVGRLAWCGLCTSQRICRSSTATSRPMSAASESTIICSGACVLTPSHHAWHGRFGTTSSSRSPGSSSASVDRRAVTPRGTDWGLALLVALGLVSGLATWFAGSPGGAWVFGAHALAGTALALLLVFKLRRVLPRVGARARRDPRTLRGLLALGLVLAVLVSGIVWSTAGRVGVAGYTVLFWHGALGAVLAVVVLAHARVRAKRAARARSRRPAPVPHGGRARRRRAGRVAAPAPGCSGRSACPARGGASPAPTTPARSPATRSRRPRGSPTGRGRSRGGYRLTVAGRVRRPLARHRRRAGPRRRAHRHAGLHRRLLLDPALARRLARPPARRGRRRARRAPRARDLAHRLPLELRPRTTRAPCCSPRTSAASRSPTATARRAASSPRGGAGSSGSSGSSASRSTRIPTRAPSPRRCGAASPPRGAAPPEAARDLPHVRRDRLASGRLRRRRRRAAAR